MRSNFFTECWSFPENLTPLGVTFILLAMVQYNQKIIISKYYETDCSVLQNNFVEYFLQSKNISTHFLLRLDSNENCNSNNKD